MRSEHQQRIDKFMELAGQDVPDKPIEIDEETRVLRAKLILEEALETIRDGLGVDISCNKTHITDDNAEFEFTAKYKKFDMVATADGCADLSVVNIGTLSAIGISDNGLLREVDENNLKKFGEGGHRREDGKWVKPPGHKPPDIKAILVEQGKN